MRKGIESNSEERRREVLALRGVDPLSGTVRPERTEDARPSARNYDGVSSRQRREHIKGLNVLCYNWCIDPRRGCISTARVP